MKHLKSQQRYAIKAYKESGMTQKFIAGALGISPSTVSRELRRNAGKRGRYNADRAQQLADIRKERFAKHRRFTPDVQHFVEKHLTENQWSPEQICGYCKTRDIPMVSTERIYQHVRLDKARGGQLYTHLRHRLKNRKRPIGGKKVTIKDRVSIAHRPEIVNQKGRTGDWEIDLIVGKENKGAIVTIVERKTKMLMMKKLEYGKNARQLAATVIDMMKPYKQEVLTITADNGTEFAEHKLISQKLGAEFYFADPYSSWQRGLNENTNKLIRQYIPKKTDFKNVTELEIKNIQSMSFS